MADREPTEFETKVLMRVAKHNRAFEGNKQIAISMALKRLIKMGYCGKYDDLCYLTKKGEAKVAEIEAKKASEISV